MELQLQHLSKRYGAKYAVKNVSATLVPGVYGLLGANGAGKSTLAAQLQAQLSCRVFHMDDFFLRPEQRFPSLEALRTQLALDRQHTREALARLEE